MSDTTAGFCKLCNKSSASTADEYCVTCRTVRYARNLMTYIYIYIYIYTECHRRNVPDFGRVFVMLNYTNITQNTYIQSWTVTEIMAREKCGLLAVPRTATVQLTLYVYTAHVLEIGMQLTLRLRYERLVTCCKNAFCVFPRGILWHAFCVWILQRQCTCCCWRIPKAFSWPKDSV